MSSSYFSVLRPSPLFSILNFYMFNEILFNEYDFSCNYVENYPKS